MTILWLDYESRSQCDLKSRGAYNYCQDISTQILCMAYAFDDADIQIWSPDQPFPPQVAAHFTAGGQIRAHNAGFDRLITEYVLCPDYNVAAPLLTSWYCTAAQARSNCAPGSLEDVGRFAGASMKKDHRGAQLVRKCCIPPFKHTAQDLLDLFEYCAQDVRAMRAVSKAMRDLSADELADYHVNERINDRGVLVDVDLCHAAMRYSEAERVEIEARVVELTEGMVTSVRSPKLRQWVLDRLGPEARKLARSKERDSIDKTVRANLLALAEENPDEIPPAVAEVIQCADDLWASSTAKFSRLAALADSEDQRVRGAFVFAGGAATGRASSYGAQVHNFPRRAAKKPVELRHALVRGHSVVPAFGPRVTDVLKSMLRPALIPEPGKQFVVADWSAIEGRVNPWLANSAAGEKKLDIFRERLDPYKVNAAATYGVAYEAVTDDQRQVGKVQELACFGPQTQVLTNNGAKAIVDVLPTDLLWDGQTWVSHHGVIYKGQRPVMRAFGLSVTEDHLLLAGQEWKDAKTVLTSPNILTQALERGSVNLPCWTMKSVRPAFATSAWSRFSALAARSRTRFSYTTFSKARLHVAMRAPKKPLDFGGKIFINMPTPVLMTTTGGDYSTGYLLAKIDATTQKIEAIRTTAPGGLFYTNLGAQTKHHFFDTFLRLMGGTSRILSWIGSTLTKAMSRAIFGSYQDKKTELINAKFKTCNEEFLSLSPVFDILNSGSRNRFTVLTEAGPLIAHNCGFGGSVGAFAAMGRVYGVRFSEAKSKQTVDAWRRANPWAVSFWQELENAYMSAMRHKGHEFSAGRVTYVYDGQHLWYMLPSGRVLCYPYARFEGEHLTYAKAAWKPAADAKEWPRARLWSGLACIAKGTPVLTEGGWVAIERVRASDRIWDGEEWVTHEGVVHQGVGRVNYVYGVAMTPDHLVLTNKGWKRADQTQGCDRASCWIPIGYETDRLGRKTICLDDFVRLRADARNEAAELHEASTGRSPSIVRVPQEGIATGRSANARYDSASGVRHLAVHAGSMSATYASSVEKLRRARDYCVSALAGFIREFLGRHGADVSTAVVSGSHQQRRPLFAGKLPLGDISATGAQQAQFANGGQSTGAHAGVRTIRDNRNRSDDATVPDLARRNRQRSYIDTKCISEVFDLINCGPRRQFVVRGIDGEPLIVHNCENVTQASAHDILRAALRECDRAGLEVIAHIHDEVVLETAEPDRAKVELERMMTTPPAWAEGLPLAVEAKVMERYGK